MAARDSDIRYFDVIVNGKKVTDEVFPILQALRPEWTKENLCQEKYSEGFINVMCCYYQRSDNKRQDALVVRLFGLEVGTLLTRDKEFLNLQIAHAAGCFPAILASFKNGLIYQYEPGRTLLIKDLNSPDMIRKIVRNVHKLQHIDVASLPLVNRKGESVSYDCTPRTFAVLGDIIKGIPVEPQDETTKEGFRNLRQKNTDEYLNKEHKYVKDILDAVKLPMGFSHGDFHPRNMIIDDDTGKLTFIDYEMSGFFYAGADIASLLRSRELYRAAGVKEHASDDKDVSPDSRELYAREYVKLQREEAGIGNNGGSVDEVELKSVEWRILDVVMKFQAIIMGLAFVNMDILQNIDVLGFIHSAYEDYGMKRGELNDLRDRYLVLKNKLYPGK